MGYELFGERDELSTQLRDSIKLMAKYGKEFAIAESEYKVELATTALELKDSGMAATMVNMVVYGTREVPKKRMKRDIAEVMYKTAQENIQSIKLQLRLIEAQIEREWAQAKREV